MSAADIEEIRAGLVASVEGLAADLLGVPSTKIGPEWRFGNHGSMALVVRGAKRGQWFDHEAEEGGDPLGLIRRELGCSFPAALRWARGFLGMPEAGAMPRHDNAEAAAARAKREAKRAEAQRIADAEKAARDRETTAYACRVWRRSIPLADTIAATYLTAGRSIPAPLAGWPDDAVRFDPVAKALVLAARNLAGEVQAIQRVYLTPAAGKISRDEVDARKLPSVKATNGPVAGASVRLPGTPGPLLLAEGPETGLSVWTATGLETWIALGSMAKVIPPAGRRIVACADDDKKGAAGASRALHKAVGRWRAEGFKVAVALPWPERRFDKTDFNDVLQAEGPGAVRMRIATAIADAAERPGRVPVAEARTALGEAMGAFFAAAMAYDPDAGDLPPVHGIKADVGLGKSALFRAHTAVALATWQAESASRKGARPTVAALIPTRALGQEQVDAFHMLADVQQAGATAAVYRGREAPDPSAAGMTMCRNLEAVKEVQAAALSVEDSCCRRIVRGKEGCPSVEHKCPFFEVCGYQKQKNTRANIVFGAHELLYSEKPAMFGNVSIVAVDEAAWQDGLDGADADRPKTLSLEALAAPFGPSGRLTKDGAAVLREIYFETLKVLRSLPNGPVSRQALLDAGITADMMKGGELGTWDRKVDPKLRPDMPEADRKAALRGAAANAAVMRMAGLFKALGALLAADGPEASGWVHLATKETDDGPVRVARLRGRHNVGKGWLVPTVLTDANLDIRLVQPYWPQAKVTATIEATTPHQRVRQIVGHDFSRASLLPDDWCDPATASSPAERKRREKEVDRRAKNSLQTLAVVLRETRARGGKPCLAVAQMGVEEAWRGGGMIPPYLDTAHHNNVAGSDQWGPGPGREGVAFSAIVGRVLPKPADVERMAEALTGRAVTETVTTFRQVEAPILMRDGTTTPSKSYQHPDAIAEAIRWQICEGQQIQIMGRPRGVNRTEANPTEILIFGDMALPVPVDEVVSWEALEPSPVDLMLAAGGVALGSSGDAAEAYPGLWPTAEAAKKAAQRARGGGHSPISILPIGKCPPPLASVTYQRVGAGVRPAVATYDPSLVPDIRAWLENRVGALKSCSQGKAPAEQAPAPAIEVDPFTPEAPILGPVVLHPPLPGEVPASPPARPARPGLLGVVAGRSPPSVEPEPGSFEAEDYAAPVLPVPKAAPTAWQAELRRRLAAVPPPALKNEPIADFFIRESHAARLAAVRDAWDAEWRSAWSAGVHMPSVGEGT